MLTLQRAFRFSIKPYLDIIFVIYATTVLLVHTHDTSTTSRVTHTYDAHVPLRLQAERLSSQLLDLPILLNACSHLAGLRQVSKVGPPQASMPTLLGLGLGLLG